MALAISTGAATAIASCVTAIPPDLPAPPQVPPMIVQDAVQPPTNAPLPPWPALGETFVVPIRLSQPGTYSFHVFVDYPYLAGPAYTGSGDGPAEGGISLASFVLPPPAMLPGPDPALCPHVVEFLVAYGFDEKSQHTPNSLGGDSVSWLYYDGLNTGECPEYDGGTGLFTDGSLDALPISPPSDSPSSDAIDP